MKKNIIFTLLFFIAVGSWHDLAAQKRRMEDLAAQGAGKHPKLAPRTSVLPTAQATVKAKIQVKVKTKAKTEAKTEEKADGKIEAAPAASAVVPTRAPAVVDETYVLVHCMELIRCIKHSMPGSFDSYIFHNNVCALKKDIDGMIASAIPDAVPDHELEKKLEINCPLLYQVCTHPFDFDDELSNFYLTCYAGLIAEIMHKNKYMVELGPLFLAAQKINVCHELLRYIKNKIVLSDHVHELIDKELQLLQKRLTVDVDAVKFPLLGKKITSWVNRIGLAKKVQIYLQPSLMLGGGILSYAQEDAYCIEIGCYLGPISDSDAMCNLFIRSEAFFEFVLAHELGHTFQSGARGPHELLFNNFGRQREYDADIVAACLVGIETFRKVIAAFLEYGKRELVDDDFSVRLLCAEDTPEIMGAHSHPSWLARGTYVEKMREKITREPDVVIAELKLKYLLRAELAFVILSSGASAPV